MAARTTIPTTVPPGPVEIEVATSNPVYVGRADYSPFERYPPETAITVPAAPAFSRVIEVVGEVGPATNGIDTVFSFTLANDDVLLESVTISAPSRADTTDDGAGNLTGADVSGGTLTYSTGGIATLTYTTPPTAGTLTIDYHHLT